MKILFLTQNEHPHVGGVEKHVFGASSFLKKRGYKIDIISGDDIKYPRIKILGLLYIWYWLFKHRSLIKKNNIIHCHDVFIWYLPFKFIYPNKKVFTTFHGWEGVWPIPWKNVFLKRLAARLSNGNFSVGKYIEKYYGIKSNKIIYGGTNREKKLKNKKILNSIVFVGRLEKDTGLLEFLKWLDNNSKYSVVFCGDGSFRKRCEKYGEVYGFTNPIPFLKKSEICVPAGYLSYIEAKEYECRIKVFPNNPLKEDYWNEIQKVKKFLTWNEVANEYISLYNSTK